MAGYLNGLASNTVERMVKETDMKRQLDVAVTAIHATLDVITHESARSLSTITDDVHAILLWLRILLILLVVRYALQLLLWMHAVLVVAGGVPGAPLLDKVGVKIFAGVTQPAAEAGDIRKQKERDSGSPGSQMKHE